MCHKKLAVKSNKELLQTGGEFPQDAGWSYKEGGGGEQVTPLIQFAVLLHSSRERCQSSLFPNKFAACLFASFDDVLCYLGSVLLNIVLQLHLCNYIVLHDYFLSFLFILSSDFSFSYACIHLITFTLEGGRKGSTIPLGICFSCAYANACFKPPNLWFFEFVWWGLCSSWLSDDAFTNWSFGESLCRNKVSDSTYTICTKDPCKDAQSLKS